MRMIRKKKRDKIRSRREGGERERDLGGGGGQGWIQVFELEGTELFRGQVTWTAR